MPNKAAFCPNLNRAQKDKSEEENPPHSFKGCPDDADPLLDTKNYLKVSSRGDIKSPYVLLKCQNNLIAAATENKDYGKNYNPGAIIIEKMA